MAVLGRATAIAAALVLATAPVAAGAARIKVGEMAPDTTITLIDGSKVTLSSLRGQVVVLNYWATWCAPCRKELPILDRYYDIQKEHGLKVFAVTTEDSLPIYQLKSFFALLSISATRKIGAPYSAITAVPMNYVIGRDGRVRYTKAGSFDLDDLNTILVPLLREQPPAAGS